MALVFDDAQITYQELIRRIILASRTLAADGVGLGSRAALLLPTCVEFPIALLALAALRATAIPLPSGLPLEVFAATLQKLGATHIITSDHTRKRLSDSTLFNTFITITTENLAKPEDSDSSDNETGVATVFTPDETRNPFILTTTSGSTGEPKAIIFSQNTKFKRARSAAECYKLDKNDVVLASTPLYHSLGQRMVLLPLLLGGKSVLLHHFSPKKWTEIIEKESVTFTIPVASQLTAILNLDSENLSRLGSLQTLVSSSAQISSEAKLELRKRLSCEVHEIYGASEVGVVSNLGPGDFPTKVSTVGRPVNGVSVKIIDEQGNELPSNVTGEICCESHMAFEGYLDNPVATAESMIGSYFKTGDLGFIDDDGFLSFVGRKKDVIIVSGMNVYPEDIEACLRTHSLVEDCAVIGVPDKHHGEAILALVVAKDDEPSFIRTLQRHCNRNLAPFQQPHGFRRVSGLPKTATGKVQKSVLRESFEDLDLTKTLRSITGIYKA